MVAYSRDVLAAPLRRLKVVEQAVSEGSFNPDETRSGRFKKPAEEARDAFLVSRKLRLHVLHPGDWESPCGMASLVKAGYRKVEELPEEIASICSPCFKTKDAEVVRKKFKRE